MISRPRRLGWRDLWWLCFLSTHNHHVSPGLWDTSKLPYFSWPHWHANAARFQCSIAARSTRNRPPGCGRACYAPGDRRASSVSNASWLAQWLLPGADDGLQIVASFNAWTFVHLFGCRRSSHRLILKRRMRTDKFVGSLRSTMDIEVGSPTGHCVAMRCHRACSRIVACMSRDPSPARCRSAAVPP